MKIYRFYFMKASYTTEIYIKAKNIDEAKERFKINHGNALILSIEEYGENDFVS